VKQDTGTHEQGALEQPVGEHEQRSSCQGAGVEHGEADQKQTRVGDGGEGEQAFEVRLDQCHRGTDQCREDSNPDQQGSQALLVNR
jgi:hypothetical protein